MNYDQNKNVPTTKMKVMVVVWCTKCRKLLWWQTSMWF